MFFAVLLFAALAAVFVSIGWLVILSFRESLLWGLAVVFVPFAALVFLVMHWGKAKSPFVLYVLSSIVLGISIFNQPAALKAYRKDHGLPWADSKESDGTVTETSSPFSAATKRAAYAKHKADLETQYARLMLEHASVRPGTSDVSAYNVKLMHYNEALRSLHAEKARLDLLGNYSVVAPPPGSTP